MKTASKLVTVSMVVAAFLIFGSSWAFAEPDNCDLLIEGICDMCGHETEACLQVKKAEKPSEEECVEAMLGIQQMLEQIDKLPEEEAAKLVTDFCLELGSP